jgi:hypothetical protein
MNAAKNPTPMLQFPIPWHEELDDGDCHPIYSGSAGERSSKRGGGETIMKTDTFVGICGGVVAPSRKTESTEPFSIHIPNDVHHFQLPESTEKENV